MTQDQDWKSRTRLETILSYPLVVINVLRHYIYMCVYHVCVYMYEYVCMYKCMHIHSYILMSIT
jgi:hypothetical protein